MNFERQNALQSNRIDEILRKFHFGEIEKAIKLENTLILAFLIINCALTLVNIVTSIYIICCIFATNGSSRGRRRRTGRNSEEGRHTGGELGGGGIGHRSGHNPEPETFTTDRFSENDDFSSFSNEPEPIRIPSNPSYENTPIRLASSIRRDVAEPPVDSSFFTAQTSAQGRYTSQPPLSGATRSFRRTIQKAGGEREEDQRIRETYN